MRYIGIYTGKIYSGNMFLDKIHECIMEYNEDLSKDENMSRQYTRKLMICPKCCDCLEKKNAIRD